MLRLNIGSGQRPFGMPRSDGQRCVCGIGRDQHFDTSHRFVPEGPSAWVNVDTQMEKWESDAKTTMGFSDGSAEIIVSHHQLEHVELSEADNQIREWHRLLSPGGSLLVFVPDMRALATSWLEGRIDDYIFMVNTYGAWMGDPADTHKFGYWGPSLKKKLNAACKWRSVRPFDWRKIPGADIAGPDFWILALEAIK